MGNSSFQGSKLEFQSLETNRFTKGNTLFRRMKQTVFSRCANIVQTY